MSNILNNNRTPIGLDIVKEDYWDFSLSCQDYGDADINPTPSRCLSVDIDINDPVCRDDLSSRLISRTQWDGAADNDPLPLLNIGLTGLDNGQLYFDPTTMSNREFLKIYSDSTLTVPEPQKLYLTKFGTIYSDFRTDADIVVEGEDEIARLDGGFWQGFTYLPEHGYKVLPTELGDGWKIEVGLKPSDFGNTGDTINALHPDNKGMFLYIGTRMENKWYFLYDTGLPKPVQKMNYFLDFVEDGYIDDMIHDSHYFEKNPKRLVSIVGDGFCDPAYFETLEVDDVPFVEDGYIEDDIAIDKDAIPPTADGIPAGQPNIREIETDNKFITYNRTKDGRRVNDGKGDERYILTERVTKDEKNYFILFNRSVKTHFDINDIEEYRKEHSRHYDVYADLYRNALGFQIKDDGCIGYRYIVKDCENGGVKVESEYSAQKAVEKDKWNDISITVRKSGKDLMRIFIYVDRRLVLVSRDLPMIKLRPLDDIYSRQETVPFSISLGGGTFGLATAVYPDFRNRPNTVLPLESTFGGTFIGYMRYFRFHTCAD